MMLRFENPLCYVVCSSVKLERLYITSVSRLDAAECAFCTFRQSWQQQQHSRKHARASPWTYAISPLICILFGLELNTNNGDMPQDIKYIF